MKILLRIYFRLYYLLRMDLPLWVSDHAFRVRLRFMSREQRTRALETSGRRLLLGSLLSPELKRELAEVMQVLREMESRR